VGTGALGDSYVLSPFFSVNYQPGGPAIGIAPTNFSMGLAGTVTAAVPEPGSLALAGLALLGAGVAGRRRRG
jgi:hypothetical protein